MHTAIYPDRNSATREPARPPANPAAGTSSRTGSLAPTVKGHASGPPAGNPDRPVSPRARRQLHARSPSRQVQVNRLGRPSGDAAERRRQTISRQQSGRATANALPRHALRCRDATKGLFNPARAPGTRAEDDGPRRHRRKASSLVACLGLRRDRARALPIGRQTVQPGSVPP